MYLLILKHLEGRTKVAFLITLVVIGISYSVRAQTETKSEKYLRPSVTNIYIDRGESLSRYFIEKFEAKGISEKYNNNNIKSNTLSAEYVGETKLVSYNGISKNRTVISETKLADFVQSSIIPNEIVKVWFPFDREKNEYSLDVIFERGINAATYQDVRIAGATMRRDAILRDAGLKLINRSYIVVYDMYETSRMSASSVTTYINCDIYLYKLEWNDKLFFTLFSDKNINNPDVIDRLTFPVKHVASLVGKTRLRQMVTDYNNIDNTAAILMEAAEVYLSQVNPDFVVRSALYATSPLRARIGIKEGLAIDKRYFVYENVQTGNIIEQKRRGTVRVRKAGNNLGKASENSEMSRFYQIHGRRLEAGMELKQAFDHGIGISIYGGTDFNALLEVNPNMWGQTGSRLPYGTKVYLKYSYPFQEMTVQPEYDQILMSEKIENYGFIGIGYSKDLCFARCLALTPYIGYTYILGKKEKMELIKKSRHGVEAGTNLTLALSPSFFLIGNANFNSVKNSFYSQLWSAGGGFRIQF